MEKFQVAVKVLLVKVLQLITESKSLAWIVTPLDPSEIVTLSDVFIGAKWSALITNSLGGPKRELVKSIGVVKKLPEVK